MQPSVPNIEKYLANQLFLDWVKRPSPAKDAYWKHFLTQHPEETASVEQARNIITMVLADDQAQPAQYQHIKTALWQQLAEATQQDENEIQTPVYILPLWQQTWLKVAASVIFLLGFTWFMLQIKGYNAIYEQNVAKVQQQKPWTEIVNRSLQPQLVVLPDHSTVILQPQSKIGYKTLFEGATREVVLSGKAFFEIERNPSKPFFVHANELVTKVLGTSFTIEAFATEKQINVLVQTGSVAVCSHEDAQIKAFMNQKTLAGLVLRANESAAYNRSNNTLSKTSVKTHTPTQLFELEEVPVIKVFEAIEKEYNVDIVVDEQMIAHCTITASLSNKHLFNKLDIICRVIQARYELIQGKIVVYAQECKH